MKFIKYGKYVGEPADAVDLDELMKRLGDFLLQSGFESQFYGLSELDASRSMEALREAILRALQQGNLLPEELMSDELRELLQDPGALNNEEMRDLIDKLIERMTQEGFINPQQPPQVTPPPQNTPGGRLGQAQDTNTEARFEITDKAIDFLGFKTLQDLLGSLGRSSFGRHDTRDLSTGIESGGVSRLYEYGDVHQRNPGQCHSPRRRQSAFADGLSRPHGSPVRIPVLLCHGSAARLQPQHDSLWRGPLHSG
jgi:Ca-activated chloride channel family protein